MRAPHTATPPSPLVPLCTGRVLALALVLALRLHPLRPQVDVREGPLPGPRTADDGAAPRPPSPAQPPPGALAHLLAEAAQTPPLLRQ